MCKQEELPKQVQLNAWAVVYSANAYQLTHYHPGAWISGVYYVNVPKNTDCNTHNGALVLGTLEIDDANIEPPWGVKYFQPTTGAMILFPSHIPHTTIPTNSDEKRICIAFNVVPISSQLTYNA